MANAPASFRRRGILYEKRGKKGLLFTKDKGQDVHNSFHDEGYGNKGPENRGGGEGIAQNQDSKYQCQ